MSSPQPRPMRPRIRTRTMSLLSVSSSASFRSLLDVTMTPPASPTVSKEPSTPETYGSFIPVRSATNSLRDFAAFLNHRHHNHHHTTSTMTSPRSPSSGPKRRRVTFKETVSLFSSSDSEDDDESAQKVPYNITRTFPNTPPKKILHNSSSPSPLSNPTPTHDTPTSTSPHPNRPSHTRHASAPSDLHPILAKLEKKSRFCTQTVYCSTCRKAGQDFPQCGKCGAMWCSRTCRLTGGKRHVCPSHA